MSTPLEALLRIVGIIILMPTAALVVRALPASHATEALDRLRAGAALLVLAAALAGTFALMFTMDGFAGAVVFVIGLAILAAGSTALLFRATGRRFPW